MLNGSVYCGAPPVPDALVHRFNLDPVLASLLLALAVGHWLYLQRRAAPAAVPMLGWAVAGAALLSPLCALSVALFSARVAQHMILILIAAPMIAIGLPTRAVRLWPAAGAFFVALWFWHIPNPYAATFASPLFYWAMHLSLFGSALWLWTGLLDSAPGGAAGRGGAFHLDPDGLAGRAPHLVVARHVRAALSDRAALGSDAAWRPAVGRRPHVGAGHFRLSLGGAARQPAAVAAGGVSGVSMAPLNYLTSAGKRAQDVLPLTWLTLGIAILTCLIFVALVLLGLRRARTDTAADTAATPVERGGQGIVWITRSLLLAAIPLAIVLVWTMIAIAQMDMPPAAGLSLDITARQWWWDVRYDDAAPDRIFRTANEIHIPVSVPVLVRLKSSDVIHSFWVPQLEASKNGRFGSEVG